MARRWQAMRRTGKQKKIGVGRMIRLISLLLFGVALSHAFGTWLFLRTAVSTEGEVIAFDQVDNPAPLVAPETGRLFYPIIEFADETDTRYVVEARRGVRSMELEPGDRIRVLYRPERPEAARVDDPMELWGATGIFGLLSAVMLFISLVAPFGFADIRGHRRSVSPVWKEED
ncbi:MAG: DUF3592 domain-containing protein [Spirochaetaceae bacterium]|nr:MAG: DUF3592 domain-containing protein [Spirochaetaceae bacterium]